MESRVHPSSLLDSYHEPPLSEMHREESFFLLDEEHDEDSQQQQQVQPNCSNGTTTRHHQHEPSVHDVSLLMRPQDADLLDSIHFTTSNSLDSPYELQVSVRENKALAVNDFNVDQQDSTRFESSETMLIYDVDGFEHNGSVISKRSHYKSPTSRDNNKTIARSEDAATLENGERDETYKKGALSGEFTLATSHDKEAESNLLHRRTESFARRINEAKQFAEAVGEMHPNEEDQLRIIEDDVHDDDSDDESNHKNIVCVQSRGQSSGESLPATSFEVQTPLKDLAVRRKSRPAWPFGSATKRGFMDKLPDQGIKQDFVYKGIRANPPNIVKRGTDRGNYAQLHRKAWLEVSDKYHRYGKHLRVYYRHWESLGCPYNMFFEWLDSKGEAAGQPLPNLSECPRSALDSDTVLYISNDETTQGYALSFSSDDQGRCRVFDVDGDPVQTGPDGWIFVLRDNVMYGAQKITSVQGKSKQRFHHSSFFGGKAVAAAGIFVTDDEGYLTRLYPHSGHYRPGDAHVQRMLFFLHHQGVDLRTFEMDIQQIQHIARDAPDMKKNVVEAGDKKKKVETLMLVPAVEVACHLAHKARFIGENIFSQIHRIRTSGASTVTEALAAIDERRQS